MNKKIATLFICTFITHLVNSIPIDSADNANLSTGSTIKYEETSKPRGPALVTLPSHLVSQQLDTISGEVKREKAPTTAIGNNTPQAVSYVSQPVTAPLLSPQNGSSSNTDPPPTPKTTVPTTPVPVTPIPVVPSNATTTETPTTPPTTTTPAATTTNATTPIPPPTTTNGTTPTTTSTPTTVTPSGTTTASVTTTPAVTPTAAPSKDRRFDGPSFVGGIVLSLGIMAIGFVAWKFYKARTERNYHTL